MALRQGLQRRRKWIALLMVVALTGAGYFAYRTYKKRRVDIPTPSPSVVFQPDTGGFTGESEKRPDLVVDANLTYDWVEEFLRRSFRSQLDIDWRAWKPADIRFAELKDDRKSRPEHLAVPTAEQVAKARQETPIVRKMPFPYYSSISVPSDCCATRCVDPYYMHTLLSRKYGLDLPGSFFPFNSGNEASGFGATFALFGGEEPERPLRYTVEIEGGPIDTFPLFLTYYHRGWVDHIHDWSSGNLTVNSLIKPAIVALTTESKTKEQQLTTIPRSLTWWQGIELQLHLKGEIESFDLEFVDSGGSIHHVVRGVPLGDRSGWDVSDKSVDELKNLYLFIFQEKNRHYRSSLGEPTSTPIKSAKLSATGSPTSVVRLASLRCFDLTRNLVIEQMKVMKEHNLLPTTTTYHGGFGKWATLLDIPDEFMRDPDTGTNEIREGKALGSQPGTPAYLSDLSTAFGLIFANKNRGGKTSGGLGFPLRESSYPDGKKFYASERYDFPDDPRSPVSNPTASYIHAESLGCQIARSLSLTNEYADYRILYTHFNFFNTDSFEPKAESGHHLSELKKLNPQTVEVLEMLSNLKYDLDGRRAFHQRVWAAPISVQMKYAQVQLSLASNTKLDGNTVRITPWTDPVTGKQVPDAKYVTQDLHGQTFYLPDSKTAKVFVGQSEITALKRNPPDFTGRPSVTVVDTHTPSLAFDDLDLYETNGRVFQEGASYYFQQRHATSGRYSHEVQVDRKGGGRIAWKPYLLNNHETDFVRFTYRKTNPKSRVRFTWSSTSNEPEFAATDGDLAGVQGWTLPHFEDTEPHEVVLDYADMTAPAKGAKQIPRGPIRTVFLELLDAEKGDSVFFDRVEFLSARGLRPTAEKGGLLVGGRVHPPRDGEPVELRFDGETRRVLTDRGGWYLFKNVPRDAIAEITFQKGGITYSPARGRLSQIARNDVEYHIFALDPRSPSVPRPEFGEQKVPKELVLRATSASELPGRYGNICEPHTDRFYAGHVDRTMAYIVEDRTNNRGWLDKDRREENPDGSLRIFLHGTCLEEGAQTPTNLHLNVVLESILRRRTGLNVEVALASHSNSSVAANSLLYEKNCRGMKPDFVVLMNDAVNMWHLEPTLLTKAVGWVKGHTPYRGFDFDGNGKLVEYPPDPDYAAHSVKPDPTPLVDDVPWQKSYFLLSDYPPLIRRSFQLFRAVIAERYLKELRANDGHLVVAAGYVRPHYPNPALAEGVGPRKFSAEKFLREMRLASELEGALFVDLSDPVQRYNYGEVLSYGAIDVHLSPSGHAIIARALADRLMELPAFQTRVEKLKSTLANKKAPIR